MAVYLSHTALHNWADPKTCRDAEDLYRAGGVRDLCMDGPRIRAAVGFAGTPVFTRFEIQTDGTVISDCPCFQNQKFNTVCMHVVAAGMAVADMTEDPRRERRLRIEARCQADRQAGRHPQPLREPVPVPDAVPASVRIRVPGTWQVDLSGGSVQLDVQIVIAGRKHAPDRIGPGRRLSFSAPDAYLLYVLEDMAQCVTCPAGLDLSAETFSQLLSEMAGSSLWLAGGATPLEVSGEQALGALRVALDPATGELLVQHRTEPDGRVLLLTRRSGWILAGKTLHPLESILPPDLHAAYHGVLRIPRSDLFTFINHRLPELERDSMIERDVCPGDFRFIEGQPSFEVHIQGSAELASASLWAVYGGTRFRVHSAPPDPCDTAPVEGEPYLYCTRNAVEEARSQAQFLSHFEGAADSNGYVALRGGATIIHVMADIAPAFERIGWTVRFGDDVASLARQALWVRPGITITASRADGIYRLDIRYTDEHDHPVSSDAVETALRTNQAVMTRDGRTLLVNVPGLNALAAALAECVEYRNSIAYVSRIHAGFIRALSASFGQVRLIAPDDWHAHAEAQQSKSNLAPAPVQQNLFMQLRPYQREGVNWLCFLDHNGYCGILADEMGLGKTVQALAWIQVRRDEARQSGHVLPAMVVCPTSLIHNWAREVRRFTPDLTYRVVSGNARQRLRDNLDGCDLVITSYALLRRDIAHYDKTTFSAVILDEAQHIKNRSTQNAVSAKRLQGLRRLVLTGTPIENSVNDLWSIMDFLMPGYLGTNTSFKIRFEQPITAGSLNADRALARLRLKLEPFMLRRLKIAVAADLPEKVTRIADCPMLPAQRRLYRRLLAEYNHNLNTLVADQGFERARFSVFSALLRLRQCCCHPALLKTISGAAEAESGKMDLFFELLDEAMDGGHRVLVFSQFVQMLHILRDALRQREIPFAYLDGSTRDRMAQVDAFNNNPAIPVFLVSLKAGGSGLNLTGANVVIHYDPWWNPAVEDQATDRTHRIGQSRTVYSIKLVTENSIEQKVIELQQRKRVVINAAIGTRSAIEHTLNWEDVQELLRPPPD
jgi:superfamily II DNA or RNA helicase